MHAFLFLRAQTSARVVQPTAWSGRCAGLNQVAGMIDMDLYIYIYYMYLEPWASNK
jgi:hypothetical protein